MTKDKTIERFIENIFQDSVDQTSSFGGYISIWYNGERVFDYPLNDLYEWVVYDHFVELIKEYFPVDNEKEIRELVMRIGKQIYEDDQRTSD